MKKVRQLLMSVLLVLTMILSGFAAGGTGALRAAAAEGTYTVSYAANAADAKGSTAPQTVEAGKEVVISACGFTREGYVFKCWTDGTATYVAGAAVAPAGNLQLKAVWKSTDAADDDADEDADVDDAEAPDDADSEETDFGEGEDAYSEAALLGTDADPETAEPETIPETIIEETPVPMASVPEEDAVVDPAAEDASVAEDGAEDSTDTEDAVPAASEEEAAIPAAGDTAAAEGAETAEDASAPAEEAAPQEDAGETAEAAEEDALLQAPTEYTVTFDLNGRDGTAPEAQTVVKDAQATKPTDPTAEGFAFVAWCTDTEGKTTYDFTSKVTENLTLYASWKGNKYTVKFDKNAEDAKGTMADVAFENGVVKALPTNAFTRDGYAFDAWNTKADGSGETYSDEQELEDVAIADGATLTLYADWIKLYTVSYDANGGTGAPAAETDVYAGMAATKPTAAPTRTGYTFKGWYTEKECKTAYDFTAAVTADLTLYAGWTPNTYTIHFDPNNGTAGTVADLTCTYDTKATLTKNAFTRPDYIFIGWNTKADRTGTTYADQAEVLNLTAENGGKVTLYAQWKFIYRVIEGANGTVSKLNTKGMTFRTNGNYALFTGIQVDGKAVAANLYTSWSGSTYVNLKQEFIQTLSIGKHTIDFLYTDGSVSTTFEVNNSTVINPVSTGDSHNMALWASLLAGAAVLAGGFAVLRKRFWS